MFRVIRETQPAWVIGENVANFLNMAFTRTKTDLESIGYNVQPFVIPACAVGAPHRRDRVWIVAYADSDSKGLEGRIKRPEKRLQPSDNVFAPFRDRDKNELPQSYVYRGHVGFPGRVDRLRALGNSVVPQIPEIIGRAIMAIEKENEKCITTT